MPRGEPEPVRKSKLQQISSVFGELFDLPTAGARLELGKMSMALRRRPGRWCRPPGFSVTGGGPSGHQWAVASRGTSVRVSASRR